MVLNPEVSLQPQQPILMMMGPPPTAAAGRLMRAEVCCVSSVVRQIPFSSVQASDAVAPDEAQVAEPGPQAEQLGQNVQLAPGYSGRPFSRVPSQL